MKGKNSRLIRGLPDASGSVPPTGVSQENLLWFIYLAVVQNTDRLDALGRRRDWLLAFLAVAVVALAGADITHVGAGLGGFP